MSRKDVESLIHFADHSVDPDAQVLGDVGRALLHQMEENEELRQKISEIQRIADEKGVAALREHELIWQP